MDLDHWCGVSFVNSKLIQCKRCMPKHGNTCIKMNQGSFINNIGLLYQRFNCYSNFIPAYAGEKTKPAEIDPHDRNAFSTNESDCIEQCTIATKADHEFDLVVEIFS